MNKILSIVSMLLLLCMSSVYAEPNQNEIDISPQKRALITEYFKVLKTDVFTRNVLQRQMAQLKKNGLKLDASVEQEFINELSSMQALLKMYGPIYSKHLTEKELSTTLSYFKSSLGQRVLEKEFKGEKPDTNSFTRQELQQIKAFQNSPEWKSIEGKMPAVSKDSIVMSNYYVIQYVKYAKQKYPNKVDLSKLNNNP